MAEISSSTQQFTDIFEITNDMLILANGTVSKILQIGTMNFGLLSEEEQDAAIYAYAGILNSLNFPIQIMIKSQSKDVTNYLNSLVAAENEAKNPAHREQIARYREFVKEWVKSSNILDKSFYVVVSADALELGLEASGKTFFNTQAKVDLDHYELGPIVEKAQELLDPKRDHLISQFGRLGLSARQINTQEIVKLFYQSYNPQESEGVSFLNSQSYSASIVSANVVANQLGAEN